jgi:octaprenyl-diphosphate synthase
MVAGEFLQLHNTGDFSTSENDYFKIIEKKTAVFIEAVCEIGSVYAGADIKQREALRVYGNALGKAFQVVDDLLDYLGDSAQTGKVVGNDFVERKMTLPLIHALENATDEDRGSIKSLLDASAAERQRQITDVRQLIERYNGFGYAKQKAKLLIETGLDQLQFFDKTSSAETFSILTGLANYVLTREK